MLQSNDAPAAWARPADGRGSAVIERRKRRTLYIFIEVGARELLSRMVLAAEARERGYRVVLGEKNLLRNLCWLFRAPPGIILDKCGQICRTRPILALKRRGFRYVVLDEEGIFFSHAKRAPDSSDLLLYNSEYQRRLSNEHAPVTDVVGNPRLHPRSLLPYLEEEIRWIRQTYGEDFILICSSFDPKMKTSYGYPPEAALDARFREQFYEIVRRLAGKVRLVYRPHPSDGEEFAARIATLAPVERRFTILPWIASTRLVVNAKCTSSFEALRLGVPSATLSLKSSVHSKLNALSRRFYDVESLCSYIEGGGYSLSLPRYKERYVSLLSGPESPERKVLDRLDAVEVEETGPFDFVKAAGRITRTFNRLWYGRAGCEYMQAKYGSLTYANRFPGFISCLGGHLVLSRD
jgi:surface carbohydrate biosynthesis protein